MPGRRGGAVRAAAAPQPTGLAPTVGGGRVRVSVCLAAYNGATYIEEQLRSILEQLGPADELIVSDDHSTDQTLQIVRQVGDPRVRIITHESNLGYTKNFEAALSEATGEYIFLSDQDDVWLPGKVTKSLLALEYSDLAISDCRTTDSSLSILSESRFEDFGIKTGFFRHIVRTRYLGCCMAMRSEILPAVLPLPARADLVEHDTWISAIGECYFRVELIREPLVLYRRHGANTSLGGFDKGYSIANKLVRRVYRLACLLGRWRVSLGIARHARGSSGGRK